MNHLSYKEIKEKYIKFFEQNNHKEINSAPLVPENDPSVLFVNAGMFPLVPFLQGEKHPSGTRLVNSQRCVRTIDIDEVGDAYHCTTFEMLGNWSLNDYFKKEALSMTLKFFVEELGFDINKLSVTVFKGDNKIPRDTESIKIWESLFKKYNVDLKGKITENGKEDNWWELPTGGPCGPDSEIFFNTGKENVEIGNNVFMEYLKSGNEYKDLGRHNVDFGGGLDRLACICQEVESIYETDIYKPIFEKVKELSKKDILESQRIITDHIKAATWIIMDGVIPSKTQQGYILRRLIRRAVRHGRKLEIEGRFTRDVAQVAINQFAPIWKELKNQEKYILDTIEEEEVKFSRTLQKGLAELDRMVSREEIDGKKAFILYETYGLPIEVIQEILTEKNRKPVDINEFNEAEKSHRNLSRTASAGLFKGGLADTSEQSTKYHTATHLLLSALRKVLGTHVYQRGSNITPERLRLDFPNEEKLTDEQIKEVEHIVNEQIRLKLPITFEEMDKQDALSIVPFSAFEEKYGDILKVYYIGPKENPFSVEICNGPHVKNTSQLGEFKIVKQESIGSGIKRIKAILI
ncbi:MAG TPA: alanine--tRNA ligase [Candidatus Dojkabacteria bacterium]|nr:alanine--tRNA ligase [Candidatus Dojkabacteria bacterium]HOR05802.1 alanine--tRNA ligase [Candidatus Dojkabacteria bacterium]HOT60811.1 alanine--tRNA ligase [Candidatus Dojkabacteria bacterium]HQI92574.1 alanine--tRNA ligase [Candidatus Dojkabacteria bacterium]